MITLRFLSVVTIEKLTDDSHIVESWLYKFILADKGKNYMTLVNPNSPRKMNRVFRSNQLTNQEKEQIEFSDLRKIKKYEAESGINQPLMEAGLEKIKEWTTDFEDGKSINSDTKKMMNDGKLLKRYRTCQAFFFHLAMIMLSSYIGIMFIGWIHINVQRNEYGVSVVDNASIWTRLAGLVTSIGCIIFKAVRR